MNTGLCDNTTLYNSTHGLTASCTEVLVGDPDYMYRWTANITRLENLVGSIILYVHLPEEYDGIDLSDVDDISYDVEVSPVFLVLRLSWT